MDLNFTAEEIAFRDEVRAYLAEALPASLVDKVRSHKRIGREEYLTWHEILRQKGWLAWHWPEEHGGTGWNPVEAHIFAEECVFAGAPRIVPFGVNMLGPVLCAFGSDAQKAEVLPRILADEDWWCQGYSEPGSGSDLASLKTRAVRDGDHYVVNGQKTWTTLGQYANKIFCLVRTSTEGKPQEGISFLLMDMDAPGVSIRPIVTIDGDQEINEVFLEDVRVPVSNLVGEENKGWTYAKYLLTYERTGIAGVANSKAALDHLKHLVKVTPTGGGRMLSEDPRFATRMAQVEIDLMAMETFNLRVVAGSKPGAAPGPESSMLKIKGTLIRQELTDLMRRATGPYALPFTPEAFDDGWNEAEPGPEGSMRAARQYFNMRKISIYGGSNEIQKNIIAKHALGL